MLEFPRDTSGYPDDETCREPPRMSLSECIAFIDALKPERTEPSNVTRFKVKFELPQSSETH